MKNRPLSAPSLALALLLTPPLFAQNHIPAGYSVETIEIPEHITLGASGLAFDAAGHLLVCSREGEVWRVAEGRWSRVADGLHEPLGIAIEPETGHLLVMQRGELTRLVDETGDGVADLYQTVSADWGLTDNYHEYAYGPGPDGEGGWFGALNTTLSWPGWAGSERWNVGLVHDGRMGRAAPYRGWLFRIAPDGSFEPWAHGLRSPAGLGRHLDGELFFTDNQGDWVPTSTLNHVVKGDFYGHPSSLMDHPDFEDLDLNSISVEEYDAMRRKPAVLLPHGDLSNSPGEPTPDSTAGAFGPFAGQIFIGDQTRSNLMRVALEKVGGEYQGAVFNFIHPLQSGCLRTVFAPDGSLWVGQTGRGWRSVGPEIQGIQRVVWDGSTIPAEMLDVTLVRDGFRIRFTRPVEAARAADPGAYGVSHWHYTYSGHYGSPKIDETRVRPSEVRLAEDGMSVEISVPLIAGKLYRIELRDFLSADGEPFTNPNAWYTLNRLRDGD